MRKCSHAPLKHWPQARIYPEQRPAGRLAGICSRSTRRASENGAATSYCSVLMRLPDVGKSTCCAFSMTRWTYSDIFCKGMKGASFSRRSSDPVPGRRGRPARLARCQEDVTGLFAEQYRARWVRACDHSRPKTFPSCVSCEARLCGSVQTIIPVPLGSAACGDRSYRRLTALSAPSRRVIHWH